jgi:hypothetical protein
MQHVDFGVLGDDDTFETYNPAVWISDGSLEINRSKALPHREDVSVSEEHKHTFTGFVGDATIRTYSYQDDDVSVKLVVAFINFSQRYKAFEVIQWMSDLKKEGNMVIIIGNKSVPNCNGIYDQPNKRFRISSDGNAYSFWYDGHMVLSRQR